MSYEIKLLFDTISNQIENEPLVSLSSLSRMFRIGRRTIQNNITAVRGITFRKFQEEAVVKKISRLLMAQPTLALKELSYAVGFKSPRSFARSIKRITGMSPKKLRSQFAARGTQTAANVESGGHLAARSRLTSRQGII
jgi:AraC-like DNA-binding protein